MSEVGKTNMSPLFEAYGAACYWAQHLERSFKLLLLMFKEKKHQSDLVVSTPLDTEEGLQALGNLFRNAQENEYLTKAEHKVIIKAIDDRNALVHAYWDKRLFSMTTPEGRQQITDNLTQTRKTIRFAAKIAGSLVDKEIEEYGVSRNGLVFRAEQEWESNQDKMKRLLR